MITRTRATNGFGTKDPSKVNMALSMYDSKKFTIAQIEEATGLKKPTIYKYISHRANDSIEIPPASFGESDFAVTA